VGLLEHSIRKKDDEEIEKLYWEILDPTEASVR
jgi:hypothetical protein